tara:strand:+ start:426 stop:704 length:279 start_codon:yes stop_codon:yes gene_type:complete
MALFNDDTFTVSLDVLDLVGHYYPALTINERQEIAEEIVNNFDYSFFCDDIHTDIVEVANNKGIDLTDKDEPIEQEYTPLYVVNSPKSPLFQ